MVKVMTLEEFRVACPQLAQRVELRFFILFRHKKMQETQSKVEAAIPAGEVLHIQTSKNSFQLSKPNGVFQFSVDVRQEKQARPFQTVPPEVQVYCLEGLNLTNARRAFFHATDSQLRVLRKEFLAVAPDKELAVKQGRLAIQIRYQDESLSFQPV